MATQLDPLTGLPMVSPIPGYDQIPLGQQVFPYADYNAVQPPARGAAYPDDIIPVGSNTHGQHPTTGNSQTIQSDGNHALKVYQVNASGGGGGGGASPQSIQALGTATGALYSATDPVELLPANAFPASFKLVAITAAASCPVANITDERGFHVQIYLQSGNSFSCALNFALLYAGSSFYAGSGTLSLATPFLCSSTQSDITAWADFREGPLRITATFDGYV